MTRDAAPTIAETITAIQDALRDYIEATYHVGHPAVIEQRRRLLEQEGVLFRAPFIESTPRYTTDRRFADLGLDGAVHELLASLARPEGGLDRQLYDPPYTHQADALEWASRDGRSLVVTTGTGSGKTESFLLPMLAKLVHEAAHHPSSFGVPAVRAMVLYPMNALVNDQLGRMRLLLGDPRVTTRFTAWGGRPARFARYTSRTLYPGVRTADKDKERLRSIERFYIHLLEQEAAPGSLFQARAARLIKSLRSRGKWPAKPDLRAWYGASGSRWQNQQGAFVRAVTLPEDPELFTRAEVLTAPPDVLITNYSMLEYMLMRPLERPVFEATRNWLAANPDQQFLLVIDEAHLYRGAAGAEVALLLRRLRARLGIPSDRLQVICTSASFASPEYAREFAAQLSGKSRDDFETVTGTLKLRDHAAPGTRADAEALAAVPMQAFYDAETDEGRTGAVASLLAYHRTSATPGTPVGPLLDDALASYGPMSLLVNETMREAQPVDRLGQILFPEVERELADRATSALIALGSAARRTANDAGLLPCRVHAFFRGLPGLWACLDPDCTEVDRGTYDSGPIGALYAQPQATCGCGARVFEFYTCRDCGTAYARAYTDDVADPSFLWQEPGSAFLASSGLIPELQPLDLLLEEPEEVVERRQLDLVTGRLNPEEPGKRVRFVFLPAKRTGEVVQTEDDEDQAESKGEFIPCGVCVATPRYGRSTVQDHQTKGDQPFLALVTRQIEVQPPGQQPATAFAPLRGRKVLAFSDSRQVAARLAPNLQTYSMRDVMRPVILRGWHELSGQPLITKSLSLEHLYLCAMVGANLLGVRLRPELGPAESLQAVTDVAQCLERGALTDATELIQLLSIAAPPPQALLRAMYVTVTDRYYGFTSLGLASIRERANLSDHFVGQLPDLPGLATTVETKLALVRLWLAQWATPRVGMRFAAMASDWIGTHGGIKSHTGKFQTIECWLGTPALRRTFANDWLPILLRNFCEAVAPKYRLLASTVALETGGAWGYCERCKFTQRPFPGLTRCINCGAARVRTLNPETDEVFAARKSYYRASSVRALRNVPPMSIIAAEHTAQLNSSQSEDVFSKSEEHELLFQDVDIEPPDATGTPHAAIDVLSCTTTMEVGIDIGTLSGVALRNMPPSRANYQQRAGRAGRRGNAVATVVAFGSADTHDDHYFRQPRAMISGRVDDPVLTMDNDEIARRHLTAYLLQRYHQDRLPNVEPDQQRPLFEVLGSVEGFVREDSLLNRTDFEAWLKDNEAGLRRGADDWLPSELRQEDRKRLLAGLVSKTLSEIDKALDLDPDGKLPKNEEGDGEWGGLGEVEDDGPAEDGTNPSIRRSETNLLDRLLYKGVLPRYAFPTDVVSFHVFDHDRSTRFRAAFQYAPSQGLAVALSQYAPGKTVWIDNKEWRSGAIYAPVQQERFRAWQQKLLYFECQVCHYAKHVSYDEAARGELRDCPACGTTATFGKAKNWIRPPGFAHRVDDPPGTSPDDAPARSYATRAKLMAPGPTDDGAWQHVTDRLSQTYRREALLVTNTGPRNEGYTYCTLCGLIEPTASGSGVVGGTHHKPYPDDRERNCPGSASTRGLVLGTDFISDVLLVRLNVAAPITLRPAFLSTQVALRTIAEGLTIAATRRLDIEATELQAEYRPALNNLGAEGLASEIYLYDTLAGGAGFTRRVSEFGIEIFKETLSILEECPAQCDESCYRCLRSFRNRFEHGLLDRHVSASLLRYLIDGTLPVLDTERLDRSAEKLYGDLLSHGIEGVEFSRNVEIRLDGIGRVTAPILAERGDQRWIFGVHGPMTPDIAPNEGLRDAKEYGSAVPVRLIDDLIIARSLPFATQLVRNTIQ
ncbi:MAG: DEAD/DEAH box helicase [Sciscionella sp.]